MLFLKQCTSAVFCFLFWLATVGRTVFAFSTTSTTTAIGNNGVAMTPFDKACIAFEKAHTEDPRTIHINGDEGEQAEKDELPYSVHYHRRMVYWLDRLLQEQEQQDEQEDDETEILQLAARCQHIRRWERPRTEYPKGLKGYKEWRTALNIFHAQQASDILVEAGYSTDVTNRIGQLLRKENLENDKDVQLLEDVICIVFLENEYTSLISKEEYSPLPPSNADDNNNNQTAIASTAADDKLVRIVQKTWKKMTPRGHQIALTLADQLTERGLHLVQRALEELEEK